MSLVQVSPTTRLCLQHTCLGYPLQAYWKIPIYVIVIDLRNLFITVWEKMHQIIAYVYLGQFVLTTLSSHSSYRWWVYNQHVAKNESVLLELQRDRSAPSTQH